MAQSLGLAEPGGLVWVETAEMGERDPEVKQRCFSGSQNAFRRSLFFLLYLSRPKLQRDDTFVVEELEQDADALGAGEADVEDGFVAGKWAV